MPPVVLIWVGCHGGGRVSSCDTRAPAANSTPSAAIGLRRRGCRSRHSAIGSSPHAISGTLAAVTGMLLLGFSGGGFVGVGDPYLFTTIAGRRPRRDVVARWIGRMWPHRDRRSRPAGPDVRCWSGSGSATRDSRSCSGLAYCPDGGGLRAFAARKDADLTSGRIVWTVLRATARAAWRVAAQSDESRVAAHDRLPTG